jgi:hypothetical protein
MDARSGPAADAAQSPDWLDGAVEAYSRRLGPPAAAELTGGSLDLGLGGHELRVNSTASQVSVASTTGEVQLTPGTGWTPLRLPGSAGTWLRVVDVPGRRLLLHTGAWAPRVAGGGALTAALRRAPVFAGAGLGSLYRDGVLGARLTDGGDGGAEGLFLSSLQCLSSSFTAAAQAALDHHRADLVIVYFPATDDAAHELIGWCDPASAACDPALGSAAWRQLRTCYGWADTLLGLLLRRAGADDTVVLSADHGIAGTAWTTYPNAALVAAGVAVADGGRLDARRCAVLYHPANNGLLCVNGEWREGGCVPAGQAGEVLRRAETVLRSVPHPLTGRPVVTGTSPAGTDSSALYLVFDTDCQPSAELPADGRVIGPSAKPGAHVTNGGDPRLHAVFAASGPGLPAGQDLGVIDSTWPAQLVLDQLSRAAADDRKARACTST